MTSEKKPLPQDAVDLFASFATDRKLELGGVEVTLPGCGSTLFRIARANNPTFQRLADEQHKKHRALLEKGGEEARDKDNEVMAEVFSQSILLGWDTPVKIKGVMTEYSQAAAVTLLALREFRILVSAVSTDFSNYLTKFDAADAKN